MTTVFTQGQGPRVAIIALSLFDVVGFQCIPPNPNKVPSLHLLAIEKKLLGEKTCKLL